VNISLLDISQPGDNKDYNGGYGTTFNVGGSLFSRLLMFSRVSGEKFPLLNFGYISAVLKDAGHQVSLDTNYIRDSADIIVLQPSLIRHREEMSILKDIRQKSSTKILLIGPLAENCPDVFREYCDAILCGDPEVYFSDNLADIIESEQIVFESKFVKDLDSLPFPDWTIYDYKQFSQKPIFTRSPTTFIQGSRSCPYKCNYCPYIAKGTKYRRRSVDQVVAELVQLKEKYGFRGAMFRDPVFSMDMKWAAQLCNQIIDNGIDMEFGCETRSDRLTFELIDLMYQAGFRSIKLGIESPNTDLLENHLRRAPALKQQEEIVKYCEHVGIKIIAFFILGLPEETREMALTTINYSKKLGSSFANFTICTPIPGTEFYTEVEDQIFDLEWNNYDNFHPVFHTSHLSGSEIKKLQERALLTYYFRWCNVSLFFRLLLGRFIKPWVRTA
tara:strand:+ start:490 stop:1821 length:1332 start_codon:yes stop_codon:yes gene_type:complete